MINSWVLLILTIHCIYINVITHATPMFVAGLCHEYVGFHITTLLGTTVQLL